MLVQKNLYFSKKINEDVIEKKLSEILVLEIKQNAQNLGKIMQSENGREFASDLLEKYFQFNRNWGIENNWANDADNPICKTCYIPFTLFNRRHHCRSCGGIHCLKCLALRPHLVNYAEEMVCQSCWGLINIMEGKLKSHK